MLSSTVSWAPVDASGSPRIHPEARGRTLCKRLLEGMCRSIVIMRVARSKPQMGNLFREAKPAFRGWANHIALPLAVWVLVGTMRTCGVASMPCLLGTLSEAITRVCCLNLANIIWTAGRLICLKCFRATRLANGTQRQPERPREITRTIDDHSSLIVGSGGP